MSAEFSFLDVVIVAGFVAGALWVGSFRQPGTAARMLPFALAYSFWVEFGARWTPAKVVPLILLFTWLCRSAVAKGKFRRIFLPSWALGFLFFALSVTLLHYVFRTEELVTEGVGSRLFQSPRLRTFVQFGSYGAMFCYYLVARNAIRRPKDFDRFVHAYLIASTSLVLYATYQWLAFYADWPFRGIMYAPGVEGFGAFEVSGLIIPRLNSLANEPKQLALFLLPSIVVIVLSRARFIALPSGRLGGVGNLAAHCIIFAMTFAVSGFFAAFIAVFVLWGATSRMSAAQGLKFMALVVGIAVATAQVVAAIVGSPSVPQMFLARVSDVAQDETRVERKVIDYLLDAPTELLFGLGPGNYNFVVREMDMQLVGVHGVDPLDSGVLTVLADFGVVGAVALLIPVSRRLLRALKASRVSDSRADSGRLLLAAGLGVVAMVQLPFVGALPHVLMFAGAAEAITDGGSNGGRSGRAPIVGVKARMRGEG